MISTVAAIDGTLKLLKMLRDVKPRKTTATGGRRKKRDKQTEPEFILIFDDPLTKHLVGGRSDCVWIAEQLWNIGNKILCSGLDSSCADIFAASHDFCLLSEEEEGKNLSRDYLDCDVYDHEELMIPSFTGVFERDPCDISSEFSAQCLLLSAATAVDYVTSIIHSSGGSSNATTNTKSLSLLRRSLFRLAQAQEEFLLNCEDKSQGNEVSTMIALLTLRCLLGVGDDSLAHDALKSRGLATTLQTLHDEELSISDDFSKHTILRNVYLMSDFAAEKNMKLTSAMLMRICATQIPQAGNFVLDLGGCIVSLGSLQRKIILSASTEREVMCAFDEIDRLVKNRSGTSNHDSIDDDSSFYSKDELGWFTIEAYNRAVHLTLLGDYTYSEALLATALNLLPLCCSEIQCHGKDMRAAYQHTVSKKTGMGGGSMSSILALLS